jgi:hypothetical protein
MANWSMLIISSDQLLLLLFIPYNSPFILIIISTLARGGIFKINRYKQTLNCYIDYNFQKKLQR